MDFARPFDEASRRVERNSSLLEVLALEEIDRDLYRAGYVAQDDLALFGGQVAAQALQAAGATVDDDRAPNSLHGYFLRAGDAERPTVFRVHRDRDGRSYSARRVEALQDGRVIFSMAASFAVAQDGVDRQAATMTTTEMPGELTPFPLARITTIEARAPQQEPADSPWPTRFWARSTADLGSNPLTHACALTYISDISSAITPDRDGLHRPGASLDHAVWFHRPLSLNDWVLIELTPHSIASERGWYTGTVFDEGGVALASFAQECLFRPVPE
ncbi:acyl-CoA thioesterase II [soil metagenome]